MRSRPLLTDIRNHASPLVIEDFATPSVVSSRRKVYEEAIAALRPRLDYFLLHNVRQASRWYAAEREKGRIRHRADPPAGSFSAVEAEAAIFLGTTTRAPQRLKPTHRARDLDQAKVNPLRRFYEFPATWAHGSTTYLRQLKIEERRAIVLYALTDYALANPGKLRRLEYSDELLFVVPSRHVEEAPPPGPSGPLAPAHLEAVQEP